MGSKHTKFCEVMEPISKEKLQDRYIYISSANDVEAHAIIKDYRFVVLSGSEINIKQLRNAPQEIQDFMDSNRDIVSKSGFLRKDIAFYNLDNATCFCAMNGHLVCSGWYNYLGRLYHDFYKLFADENHTRVEYGDPIQPIVSRYKVKVGNINKKLTLKQIIST